MSNDLEAIREAGMKALLRFGYTHTDPTVEGFVPPYGDASLSVASAHITQLSPIFKVCSFPVSVAQHVCLSVCAVLVGERGCDLHDPGGFHWDLGRVVLHRLLYAPPPKFNLC